VSDRYEDRLHLGGSEELRQVYILRSYRAKELPITVLHLSLRERFLGYYTFIYLYEFIYYIYNTVIKSDLKFRISNFRRFNI